jgi:hypothetical protein
MPNMTNCILHMSVMSAFPTPSGPVPSANPSAECDQTALTVQASAALEAAMSEPGQRAAVDGAAVDGEGSASPHRRHGRVAPPWAADRTAAADEPIHSAHAPGSAATTNGTAAQSVWQPTMPRGAKPGLTGYSLCAGLADDESIADGAFDGGEKAVAGGWEDISALGIQANGSLLPGRAHARCHR